MKLKLLSCAIVACAVFAAPAVGQIYRFLDYDMEHVAEITGTVQQLEWMNPNSELHILVRDDRTGKTEEWTLVMGPPSRSTESGWTKDSVKPGDLVTLKMHPSRDGSHSGQLVSATLPDGRTLQATEPNPAG